MKKIKSILAISAMSMALLYSCGGDNRDNQQDSEEDKSVIGQMTESVGAMKELSKLEQFGKDLEKRMNELKALSPVSNEELKAVLPETLQGLKRTSLRVGEMNAMGVASATAEYENQDNTQSVEISVIDGAGEGGSGIVSLMFYGFATDREEITEDGFEKTTEIDGRRVLVKESKYEGNIESEIKWIHQDRYAVELDADGYSLDELTTLFKAIDLSALK